MHENILVTGGAGFIGSAFAIKALEAGKKVIALDLLTYAGNKSNLEPYLSDGKIELIVGNINDHNLVAHILKSYEIDAVINFAAESHVDNSISSPSVFIETNITGVFKLMEASRLYYNNLTGTKKEEFRFIQISTDEVYGELPDTGKLTEESNYRPNSPYSASKAASDMLARAWYKTYGFPVITTNSSKNYGPRQFPEKLIPKTILNGLNGDAITVYVTGKNIRDWIHVEDHASGIMLALSKGKVGETYCFGGQSELTNNDVVTQICDILDQTRKKFNGKSFKELISYAEDREGHDFRYAIDDSKAVNELGFTRKYSFEVGIKNTINWYCDNQNWIDGAVKNVHISSQRRLA